MANAFQRAFGAAPEGPLQALADVLAPSTGDPAAMVAHVLRFTLPAWTAAEASNPLVRTTPVAVRAADFTAWLQRFGVEGDAAAYANARALFVTDAAAGTFRLAQWYHGLTAPSAGAAQALLAGKPPGSFLFRVSGSEAGSFAISYVIAGGECRHTRIRRHPGAYKLQESDRAYATLADVAASLRTALVTPVPSALSEASQVPLASLQPPMLGSSEAMYAPVAAPDAAGAYGAYVADDAPPAAAGGAGATPALPAAGPLLAAGAVSDSGVAAGPSHGVAAAASVPTGPTDLFVSYAWGRRDPATGRMPLQEKAHKLVAALRAQGYTVWLDVERMPGGATGGKGTDEAMAMGIMMTSAVVVCFSDAYARSAACKSEAQFASKCGKPILFVNLGEPGWTLESKLMDGDAAAAETYGWLSFMMLKALWSDARDDEAMTGPAGLPVLLSALAANPKVRRTGTVAAAPAAAPAPAAGGAGGGAGESLYTAVPAAGSLVAGAAPSVRLLAQSTISQPIPEDGLGPAAGDATGLAAGLAAASISGSA